MRKFFLISLSCFFTGFLFAVSTMPAKITYQGTLKQKGVPFTGTMPMEFKIIDKDDTITYWNSQAINVTVTQGLFSQQLSPTNAFNSQNPLDWENTTPYIQVILNPDTTPVTLAPSEAITTTMFSLVAGTVLDGSITPAKLDASAFQSIGSVGLVPTGAILMFAGPCPNGWTYFTPLNNRFPHGNSVYGGSGGNETHSHSGTANSWTGHGATASGYDDGKHDFPDYGHTHTLSINSASNMPPYLDVVFCQKQ